MNNIKHDEKKIEEMIVKIKPNIMFRENMGGFAKRECESVISQLWDIQKRKAKDMMEQYAEHMVQQWVQQEKERIVGEINNLTPYSIGRDEIGNVISKGSVIKAINRG
jgi:hypothetical protein